jgi:hypothetical protein
LWHGIDDEAVVGMADFNLGIAMVPLSGEEDAHRSETLRVCTVSTDRQRSILAIGFF